MPKRAFVFLGAATTALFMRAVALLGAAPPANEIVFVHLRFDGAGVALVEAATRPGTLKPPPDQAGHLQLEVLSEREEVLWREGLADPRLRRLEYEDPANPGSLVVKPVPLEQAEFTVRVPRLLAAGRLALYDSGALAPSGLRQPGAIASRRLLGTVNLPPEAAQGGPETSSTLEQGRIGLQQLSSPALLTLLTNGPLAKRLNMVFVSEGYRSSEASSFTNHVRIILSHLLSTPPFDDYPGYFNAFAIFVASAQSGSDHPSRGIYRDTYFNSTFDSYGIEWLVTIPPNDRDTAYAHGQGKMAALLQALVPEYDLVFLIVNDTEYGGSGGFPIIATVSADSADIAIHELGHSLGGLGDEYGDPYPGYPDTEEPNTTTQTKRALVKWNVWILATTPVPTPATSPYLSVVGLFEGAHYHATGWYRPRYNCRMRSLGVPFCEVCSETLIKSAYRLVGPIASFSPNTSEPMVLTGASAATFSIQPMQPASFSLSVQWLTNGAAVARGTNAALPLAPDMLAWGTNQVSVQVADLTAKVRTDPTGLLQSRVDWTVINYPSPPQLLIARDGNRVKLCWPAAYGGFAVQTRLALAGAAWGPLGVEPNLANGQFTTVVPAASAAQFFRLRWP